MRNEHLIISSKLKELRKGRSMTQAKLAKRANLHETIIAKMEKGSREISATELAKIARILGVNMNVFFYRDSVFSGAIEEAVIESLGLMSEAKQKRVIDILKVDLFLRSKRAKGEQKIKFRKLRNDLEELKFED